MEAPHGSERMAEDFSARRAASIRRRETMEAGFGRLFDCLFPRICPLCGRRSDRPGRMICWECLSALPVISADQPHCVRCGKVPDGVVDRDFLCDSCRIREPAFDMARFALPFRFEARCLIHAFKYRNAIWLREDLVDLLEGCVVASYDVGAIDWVLPVPLHPLKLIERTYNQADYLARSLAERLGRPYSGQLVRRAKRTPTQTHLGAQARRKNVEGAFRVVRPGLVRGRTILVVDDVMTTGATLSSIASRLKAAGAWRVWTVTIGRG